MLRLVEFIWRYENAKEVVFSFGYSTPENERFVKELRDKLSPHCSVIEKKGRQKTCLLYTSPSPRDQRGSRMPSSA